MPFKYTKTTPANLPWGRSVKFDGTNQYLSLPASSNWAMTGSFTIESWYYPTADGTIITLGNEATNRIQVRSNLTEIFGGAISLSYSSTLNQWNHIAAVRGADNIIKIYVNGSFVNSASYSSQVGNSSAAFIGVRSGLVVYFNGYISNTRVVNGTALYTASFTPPTSPLNVVPSASLLACHDTSIKDGSVNNFTITNNNAATVSTLTPFVVSTKSVLFNGSNNLQTPSDAAFAFGTGDWTIDCWIRTATSNAMKIWRFSDNSDNLDVDLGFSTFGGLGYYNGSSSTYSSAGIITSSIWYHIAAVRKSGTVTVYLNGNAVINQSSTPNSSTRYLNVGSAAGSTFNGYISNFRVVKGTALYTASFTAPTAPLTAIANTSLLTCNAPTIVDSSNNNFTITNNGSATVSSVVPFNAVGYGYKFKNVSSTAASKFNFKQAAGAAVVYLTQKAIFGYGLTAANVSITNLVSNTGVVATDTTGVGTTRRDLAAARYDADKAIFGYGLSDVGVTSITNLVSNTGVVATDTTGVGTARDSLAAAGYGIDKAIFGYGSGPVSMTNLVSNTGVVANDTAGVGTARQNLAAAGYGIDKAIFGYGSTNAAASGRLAITNLVSNTGVVATDTTGVGTARYLLAAAGYGTDKAIFGYGNDGSNLSITNLVSNTGVVATDTAGVGTARRELAAAGYGTDKAIFGYGYTASRQSMTNLVSNTGVVATDTTGVGTARRNLAAAGYSLT